MDEKARRLVLGACDMAIRDIVNHGNRSSAGPFQWPERRAVEKFHQDQYDCLRSFPGGSLCAHGIRVRMCGTDEMGVVSGREELNRH